MALRKVITVEAATVEEKITVDYFREIAVLEVSTSGGDVLCEAECAPEDVQRVLKRMIGALADAATVHYQD